MKRADVIILGAGAAGLLAARDLCAAGRSVLILEARDRIGGRIHTLSDPRFPIPVEMGAEFIHGRPQITFDLLRQANQLAIDLPFDHRLRRAGHLAHLDDVSAELRKVMSGLAHLGPHDKSFAQYLRDQHASTATPAARAFATHFVEGFDAADPERISAQSLAQEQQVIGDVGEKMQFRPLAGYKPLIAFLHKSLPANRARLLLNTSATEILWSKSKIQVLCKTPAGTQTFRAPKLLVTIPLGVLQLPPETTGAIRFVPDIPAKRLAAAALGSGPIVKAVLKFRHAFWENPSTAKSSRTDKSLRDAVFLHQLSAPFPTWWTARPLHVPVLTAWAGGPHAIALASLSKSQIKSAALASLSTLFNQPIRTFAPLLERFHFYDWASDPNARGAYSYVAVGGQNARAQLAKPIQNTLFFAGEATDTSGQASTVAGALISGQRAAKQLLKNL